MTKHWFAVRLELARTPDFPEGSATRAYFVHLPLHPDGHVDEFELASHSARAIVRRFWPDEPDLVGLIVPAAGDWVISYRDGPEDDERIIRLTDHPVCVGNYLTLQEPNGDMLPYWIAEIVAS